MCAIGVLQNGAEIPMPHVESDLYRVVLLNDDKTPMEFVVDALQRFLDMDRDTAIRRMLRIHHEGMAECGTYSYDEATKIVNQVLGLARERGHPLRCVVEKIVP
jgi:ATP-dependent Clp protease adaptor protein ClpS